MPAASLIRRSIVVVVATCILHAPACAREPATSPSNPMAPSGLAASGSNSASSSSSSSPAPQSSLPQLPVPSASPTGAAVVATADPTPDTPHVAYRGADPFEPPPSPPVAFAPIAARPAGTDPTPADRASYTPYCGAVAECGPCTNMGKCGYCLASKQCIPKDRYGAFPGMCRGGFVDGSCPLSAYAEREEPKTRAKLGALMRGLAAEGQPIDTRVDAASHVVRVPVRRGYCYGVVYRASLDIADPWSLGAAAQAQATFVGDGGDWIDVYQGAGALTPFCPQQSGVIVVGITPKSVAGGTWRVQLFRRSIADADLRDQADKREAELRRDTVRYYCAHCTRGFLGCRLDGEPQCNAKLAACFQGAGIRPEDCERGDIPRPPKPKPPFDVSLPPGSTTRMDAREG